MENIRGTKLNSYLTFRLEDGVYALNASNILHILEMVKITKIPKAPDYLLGVINLRGLVLPVIDTRKKFELQPTSVTAQTCILVLEVMIGKNNLQLGIVVDEVKEVIELTENMINEPPSIGDKYKADFLEGMAIIDDAFIMILNLDKFLSGKELKVLDKAAKTKEEIKEIA